MSWLPSFSGPYQRALFLTTFACSLATSGLLRVETVRAEEAVAEVEEGVPETKVAPPRASAAVAEPYEPKSDAEEHVDETIEARKAQFLDDALRTGAAQAGGTKATKTEGSTEITRADWWAKQPLEPVFDSGGKTVSLGLFDLYQRALEYSDQIKVFKDLPLIRETAIDEARGRFDTELYALSRYDRTDEPIGSTLETGRPGFFREEGWEFEGGLRKRFLTGAQVSVAQELSQVTNNSEFFTPPNQGLARLRLAIQQPLLRGAGIDYNRGLVQIAKLDAEAGYAEFMRQVETHLMELNRSYWALYLSRASLQEMRRLVTETETVVEDIETRANLDANSSLLIRARSALATRRAALVRSELEVKNVDSRLRSLINDPDLVSVSELIPADLPISVGASPAFDHAVTEALANRAETRQAEAQLRAAVIREKMARNERRMELNLIGEIGISALRESGDWASAYGDQWRDEAPSWGVGVVASIPLGNREAKSRHRRTQLEIRQQTSQLRSTMDTVLLEVQMAHREVITAYPDMRAKWDAAVAAEKDLSVLMERIGLQANAAEDTSTSLYLERVLDAQLRRSLTRDEFLRAQAVYNASLTNLERAKGTLLQEEAITVRRVETDDDDEALPLIELVRDQAQGQAKAIYESVK